MTRDTRPSRGTSSNTGLPWTFKTSSDILVFARPSSHQRSFLSLFFSLMFLVCFVCADHARSRRTKQRCIGRRRWASGTWWASCCDPTPTPTYRTKTVRMRVASGGWLNESHYLHDMCAGWTALHVTCYYAHHKIVSELLSCSRTDVNIPNKDGWTPRTLSECR